MRYELTAVLPKTLEVSEYQIEAADDSVAMFQAIDLIMDMAYQYKNGPWAKGSITLRDAHGAIVAEMPAKEDK